MNATQFTLLTGVSRSAVNRLLAQGLIAGASRDGRDWIIPNDWFDKYELRRYSDRANSRVDVCRILKSDKRPKLTLRDRVLQLQQELFKTVQEGKSTKENLDALTKMMKLEEMLLN